MFKYMSMCHLLLQILRLVYHPPCCVMSAIVAQIPHIQPFQGMQMSGKAHLASGACLGSWPCFQGESELMVLKWCADGDSGLIAV